MTELPLAAIDKLMREQGTDRTSIEARKEMKKILETHLIEMSIKASQVAKNSKRKTIFEGDIDIANM